MSHTPHQQTSGKHRLARWLLLVVLVTIQSLSFAHELTHHDLADSGYCAVCSVGGDSDGAVKVSVQPPAVAGPTAAPATPVHARVGTAVISHRAPRAPPHKP